MRKDWVAVIGVASLLGWSAPIMAKQGRGHGRGSKAKVEQSERRDERRAKGEHERERPAATGTTGVSRVRKHAPPIAEQSVVIDRDGHRRVVTEYFSRESLPPGLAKRRSLPPGLQKQLRERGRLPPGLQKRLVPVPQPLMSRLPALPRDFSRYFAGRDLIVVDRRTNAIVAVIPDVVALR
jgi:hypothetical protein